VNPPPAGSRSGFWLVTGGGVDLFRKPEAHGSYTKQRTVKRGGRSGGNISNPGGTSRSRIVRGPKKETGARGGKGHGNFFFRDLGR